MDIAFILNPVREPKAVPRKRSCNKAYTLEQIHFVQYCREDLMLTWPDTEARFIKKFPDPTRDVSKVGLQCRYYRAQKYPMLDIEGNPVLTDSGMIIMHNLTLRERGHKGGLIVPILDDDHRPMRNEKNDVVMRELNEDELRGPSAGNLSKTYQKYFKLIDRAPECAAGYAWVNSEDQLVAMRSAKYNEDHGIALPGAILPGGVEMNTILWAEELARRGCGIGEDYQLKPSSVGGSMSLMSRGDF